MERLSIGNLVRIKGREGIWRVVGILHRSGGEELYHFGRADIIEGGVVNIERGGIDMRVEGIEIGESFLLGNGFVYRETGRLIKEERGDGLDCVIEYDLDGRNVRIWSYGDIVKDGACKYIHEFQDMICDCGYEYIGRRMVVGL